jgi:2'-5' RNA ligase
LKLRAFVAVELSNELKEAIFEDAKKLKESGIRASYPLKESYHITLKFLGNIEEKQVDEILEAIGKRLEGFSPFEIEVSGRGAFPNLGNPRVLWCGVSVGAQRLKELSRLVEEALEPLGFEREKKEYHPHVTLCRIKRVDGGARRYIQQFGNESKTYGRCRIGRVVLFKSILRPEGAIYEELGSVQLGGR